MGWVRSSLLKIWWVVETQTHPHRREEIRLLNMRSSFHEIWSLIEARETPQQRQGKGQKRPRLLILIIITSNNRFNFTAASNAAHNRTQPARLRSIGAASGALLNHTIYLISSLNSEQAQWHLISFFHRFDWHFISQRKSSWKREWRSTIEWKNVLEKAV